MNALYFPDFPRLARLEFVANCTTESENKNAISIALPRHETSSFREDTQAVNRACVRKMRTPGWKFISLADAISGHVARFDYFGWREPARQNIILFATANKTVSLTLFGLIREASALNGYPRLSPIIPRFRRAVSRRPVSSRKRYRVDFLDRQSGTNSENPTRFPCFQTITQNDFRSWIDSPTVLARNKFI